MLVTFILTLIIGRYALVVETKKPTFKSADRTTFEEVRTQTKYINPATQEEVSVDQLTYYQDYGQEKLQFTAEEVKKLKVTMPSGVVLLGFKPRSCLAPYHNMTHSYFLYPDESAYNGSITTFTALLLKMVELDRIAICRMQMRSNSTPKLAALLPQTEIIDENGIQERAPGMYVIILPFGDEIRDLGTVEPVEVPDEQVEAATAFLKKLKIKHFNPNQFPNPVLQRCYAKLERLALEETDPIDVNDVTMPNLRQFDRAADLFAKFRDLLPEEELAQPKRKARKADADEDGEPAPKKKRSTKKKQESDEEQDDNTFVVPDSDGEEEKPKKSSRRAKKETGDGEADVAQLYQDGKLNKLTVAQLKDFLKLHGLPTTGKKADLVDRIEEMFEGGEEDGAAAEPEAEADDE